MLVFNAILLVVVLLAPFSHKSEASYKTIGESLYAKGYTRSACESFSDDKMHLHSNFSPNVFDYAKRYGFNYLSDCKGSLVGDRSGGVEEVVKHPSNPLDIENNTTYKTTEWDMIDIKVSSKNNDENAYDTLIIPLWRKLIAPTLKKCSSKMTIDYNGVVTESKSPNWDVDSLKACEKSAKAWVSETKGD